MPTCIEAVGVEQAFLGGAAERGAMREPLAEVDVPGVEVGVEVDQGNLAESSMHAFSSA